MSVAKMCTKLMSVTDTGSVGSSKIERCFSVETCHKLISEVIFPQDFDAANSDAASTTPRPIMCDHYPGPALLFLDLLPRLNLADPLQ